MQRDIDEIDWVFCWRTSTGEVGPGARDTAMNGHPVRYRPDRDEAGSGLRTIVRGRVHACPRSPRGFRLDEQGALSRMGCFVQGHVTGASLVPARNERELEVLQEAARACVLSGEVREWALAEIGAEGGVRWALHVGARPSVVSAMAARVKAPWTLRVGENEIARVDRRGRVGRRLAADTVFDVAQLPGFVSRWRETRAAREREARERVIDEILADIPAYKAKLEAQVSAQYPDMTDEQHEASWGLVAKLMGFGEEE